MNMKILRGTIVGGVAFFFLGWLIWGIFLWDYMLQNSNTTLNRPENEMIWWAMIASNLVLALLQTLILKWAGARNWIDGLKIGALVGALYALSVDLGIFSMTTMMTNMSLIIVDALAYALIMAVTGALIVLTWGKS